MATDAELRPNDFTRTLGRHLRFRVPRLRPGLYQFVIYCGPCYPGKNGSLITDRSWSLRVGR